MAIVLFDLLYLFGRLAVFYCNCISSLFLPLLKFHSRDIPIQLLEKWELE